ncbi:MAG: DNA polymerase III subunit chi [Desulfuromonas sp.]|uniref:DNA polymerase III subunit chi n=1 Tax=Desulfuromonas sp. TaxID=892 RepID=UPI000CC81BFD|nr:DNA polymerase III subunit chi [Desulfuromonas sp.]PLX84737.1 MAG: DNA polymerase III subunit chi [Desulfuromonas sp.]
MTKVHFIKLRRQEKARHLCDLADEFYGRGRRVLITVQDQNQGVTLDRFMWTWKKDSFIPHAYDNGAVECLDEAVVIGNCERNPNGAKVLIMGKPCGLEFLRQFEDVIDFAEIFDDQLAAAARDRFASYREAGLEPGMRQ